MSDPSYNDLMNRGATTFDNTARSMSNSAMITTIVLVLVGAFVIIGIVFAMYKCFEKSESMDATQSKSRRKDLESSHVVSNEVTNHSYSTVHVSTSKGTIDPLINNMDQLNFMKFSSDQVSSFTHNYSTKLGSGGFGDVYKGVFPNFTPVAIKVLRGVWDETMEETFMAEVRSIGKAYHCNLVRLYGYCFEKQLKALVFEYIENGGLDRYFNEECKIHDWGIMHEIAKGIAKGVMYLHEDCHEKIIHFDIKPDNILLDGKLCPKIADFGLAKLYSKDISHMSLSVAFGTRHYVAPELVENYPPRGSDKCDVYSYGVMLFEILSRKRIYSLLEGEKFFYKWAWEKYEVGEMRDVISKWGIEEKYYMKAMDLSKVAFHCIHYDPKNRPSMKSVVRMLEGEVEIAEPTNPIRQVSPLPPLTCESLSNQRSKT